MDSTESIESHRKLVKALANIFICKLARDAIDHDMSKLSSPEKEQYDKMIGEKGKHPYDSPEYNENIAVLGKALDHHYKYNSHHPEHFKDGISGMTLIDLVMMYIDWKASMLENPKGDMCRSIHLGAERFSMDSQLVAIFENTTEWFDKQ